MVAWRSSVKGRARLLLLGVCEAGQVEIQDNFVAQRNAVQFERAVASFKRVEVTNHMMETKALPLIKLQGRNTGGSGRNDQAPRTASGSERSCLLHQRRADAR